MAIDVDVRRQDLVDAIVAGIEQRVGPTPLVRQGQAPKLALLYRTEAPFKNRATPKLQLAAGEKPTMVEIFSDGGRINADGIHPDTGQPYQWLDQSPLEVPLSALPVLSEVQADEILELAEALLRGAGAEDWVDPNKPESMPRPDRPKAKPRKQSGPDGFFGTINDEALGRADEWVRYLFPRAKKAPNGAWRVTAAERGLPSSKQDLSIDPQNGIRDWHLDKPYSPIDLVME